MGDSEVFDLLVRGLRIVGRPQPETVAEDLVQQLEAINVVSALQLCHLLNVAGAMNPAIADLRSVLKGPLLEAVRDASQSTMDALKARAPVAARGSLVKQRIEIARVDLLQICAIDQRNQSFRASLFVQACLPGGNCDEALRRPDEAFPLDMYGRPTFKPSASWYLTQVEFQVTHRAVFTRLSSVATAGDDLM